MKPLCIDLFCGLGGWTEGFLAEGYEVIGFDIELRPYPAQLVLQDVLTLHGSQFRHATCIVASPPCQAYSYRAMPWKKAKALPPPSNALFEACFRIQREACEAAGRHITMVVENVCGAQKWVGKAAWHYGSYYLWGDVPALMPFTSKASKVPVFRFDGSGGSFQTASVENTGIKAPGMNWSNPELRGQDFTRIAAKHSKNTGGSWFNVAHNTTSGCGNNPDGRPIQKISEAWRAKHYDKTEKAQLNDAVKQPGIGGMRKNGKGDGWFQDGAARHGSKSNARKQASAMIAKIPFPLASHIARVYK